MIVYGASMSPYVRKVLAFAAEKGVEVEVKPIAFGDPDPDFRTASPFGKIPALKDGDFTVSDSTAIIMYLDALHPEPNLIPAEPRARARTFWWDEFADTLLMDCGRKMFFHRVVGPMFMGGRGVDPAVADKAEAEELPRLLDYLEGEVPDAGGFLVEDRITLADLAVASPFANLIEHLGIAISAYPRTAAYVRAILERPSLRRWVDKEARLLAKLRAPA